MGKSNLAKRLHYLRVAVRKGNIIDIQDKLGYNQAYTQRMIADPELVRQTMLDLEKQLGPSGSIWIRSSKSPILALEMLDALRDLDKVRIKKISDLLILKPDVIKQLCRGVKFRNQAIRDLEIKLDIWACKSPLLASELFPRVPEVIEKHYFDKDEFIRGMMSEVTSLKARAFISMPGGIRFLERMLDLPLTGVEHKFMKNYCDRYYTRQGSKYLPNEPRSTRGAAEYHDMEMIERYCRKNPKYAPIYIVEGAARGGHLDLIRTYAPKCPPIRLPTILNIAARSGRLEIFVCLHSFCQQLLFPDDYMNLLTCTRHLEMYRFIATYVNQPLPDRVIGDLALAGCQEILDYIDPPNIRPIIVSAIFTSNLAMLRRYLPRIPQPCEWHPDAITGLFAGSKNVKVSRLLYDAGLRPSTKSLFAQMLYDNYDLEVLKFNLSTFDIVDQKKNLSHVIGLACRNPKLEVFEAVMDHPKVVEAELSADVVVEIILSNGHLTLYNRDNRHLLLEILIARDYRINSRYLLDWIWRYSEERIPMLETVTGYMRRLGIKLTQAEYEYHISILDQQGCGQCSTYILALRSVTQLDKKYLKMMD